MTAEQLVEYLIAKTGDEVDSDMLTKFQQQKITGLTFLDLKESDLKDIIPLMGERKAILQLQKLTCFIIIIVIIIPFFFYTAVK